MCLVQIVNFPIASSSIFMRTFWLLSFWPMEAAELFQDSLIFFFWIWNCWSISAPLSVVLEETLWTSLVACMQSAAASMPARACALNLFFMSPGSQGFFRALFVQAFDLLLFSGCCLELWRGPLKQVLSLCGYSCQRVCPRCIWGLNHSCSIGTTVCALTQ